MWRKKYHYRWALFENWLLLIATDENGKSYALEPIGPPPRNKAVLQLLDYLSRQPSGKPEIDRADKRIVGELQADQKFIAEPLREHFDYLYYTPIWSISLEGGFTPKETILIVSLETTGSITNPSQTPISPNAWNSLPDGAGFTTAKKGFHCAKSLWLSTKHLPSLKNCISAVPLFL